MVLKSFKFIPFPNISLINGVQYDENIKIAGHGNAWIKISEKQNFVASAYYFKQGEHQEFIIGSHIRIELQDQSKYEKLKGFDIVFGSYYRIGDALIPSVGIRAANYEVNISYDINTSPLSVATKKMGGLEIGVIFKTPNPFLVRSRIVLQQGDQRI